jgi:hypothetical protein
MPARKHHHSEQHDAGLVRTQQSATTEQYGDRVRDSAFEAAYSLRAIFKVTKTAAFGQPFCSF